MSKFDPRSITNVGRFLAIRKWKMDGGEETVEYFATLEECLAWIAKRPTKKEYTWTVGEY